MSPVAGEIICGPLGGRLSGLVRQIDAALKLPELVRLAPQIREIGVGLVDADAGASLVTRVVTALNDRLTERLVAVLGKTQRLPAAAWCWLAFGSEGRGEQTFATDQDNGLIFSAASAAEAQAMRQLFLPFCQSVNEALDACGFTLCAGGIMAGNTLWCLSQDEWRERFSGWIRTPDPAALLNATIFFDFRPLCGNPSLAAALRDYLLGLTAANEAFIRMMANNALAVAPPLGLLGDIVPAGGSAGGVDLKTEGTRLFVDAARVFALAQGVPEVGTVARLRAVAKAGRFSVTDAAAAEQAFVHIQGMRLALQAVAVDAGGPAPGNCADTTQLNEFERRVLKEALMQARRLQHALKISFKLEA